MILSTLALNVAPLAHIGLALIGEGLLHDPADGKYSNAAEVLARYGLKPQVLEAKDGLSLVNGTQFITGIGSEALELSYIISQIAQPVAALSFTALRGFPEAFDERVHNVRPHVGQKVVAHIMRDLLPEKYCDPDYEKDVQDPYSLRYIFIFFCVILIN